MTAYFGSWLKTIADLFGRNILTIFGASLTTLCVLLMSALTAFAFLNIITTPYLGILIFLILPALFVTGLLIIPIGAVWDRYRRAHHTKQDPYPLSVYVIDLREPRTRRAVALVSFLTLINIAIVATVTYKGFIYTESVPFCGQVCHTVMEPEFTAHSLSPHSRVRCTECHIGPGAPWFVRSKISGLGQVIAVLRNSYERPIPTPVKNLRPSRDTCEQCHWPERFSGDRIKVKKTFKDDELNTPLTTALLMHIGGGNSPAHGIHSWHIRPGKETRYLATDESRQQVALVRVKDADGTTKNFASADFKKQPEDIPDESMRVMDCIDCHNRPTHILKPANQSMDAVLADGDVDITLPYLKKIGLEAILSAQKT